MTDYNAPTKDMRFVLREIAGLDRILELNAYNDVDGETVDQVLDEAETSLAMCWRR